MIVLSANETQYHVYRNPNATHQTSLGPYDVAHYINREVSASIDCDRSISKSRFKS